MNSKVLRNWYEVPFIFSYLKVDSRTLIEISKVQMNLNYTYVIRGKVNVL